MKKIIAILFGFILNFISFQTLAVCSEGAGTCNDIIDFKEIPSNQEIEALLNVGIINATKLEVEKFGLEQIKAYYRSLQNGITTKESVKEANLGGEITRAELAKMISNYAIEILGKELNTTKECNFNDISNEFDEKYDKGITHSCQLGLMGQNIKDFRPNDGVTRAEFGTVLSRALWGNQNEGGSTYYENHLKALKSEGIMKKINTPMNKEIRGYVMLMLMRSTNTGDLTTENLDNQIQEVIEMLD